MEKVFNVAFAFERGQVSMNLTTWAEKAVVVKNLSAVSAMTACAMGNFHCDVAYCKRSFCNSDSYRAKFGNLSWSW